MDKVDYDYMINFFKSMNDEKLMNYDITSVSMIGERSWAPWMMVKMIDGTEYTYKGNEIIDFIKNIKYKDRNKKIKQIYDRISNR